MTDSKIYRYLGITGALLAPTLAVAATQIPHVFQTGDPVSSSEMNANFSSLGNAVDMLEQQLAGLQAELDEARTAAGHITLSNGTRVPYYRKVLKATRSGTTTTIPHGITGNPASERRFIGCEVMVNYDSNGPRQTSALNIASGASTATYCDMDDTTLLVNWYNSGALEFQISLLYTAEPLD